MNTAHETVDHSQQFIHALEAGDVEELRLVPKTELHSHGNLAFHSYEISQILGIEIPPPPAKFHDFTDFIAYIKTYLHPLTDTKAEMEHILFHAIEMAVDDGVVALEMSIDCKFSNLWDSPNEFLSYMEFMVDHFKHQVDFRPELGLNRADSMENLIAWGMPLIESGVFKSVDLYGNEAQGDLSQLKHLFKAAKAYGLKLKAHSGEFGTPKDIFNTIEKLGLQEIQHGINAVDDKNLLKYLRESEIALHICPTSNVMLSRVESMERHPVKKIADAGVVVTLNSDDLAVFDQTVSQEYLNVFQAGLFSASELDLIRLQTLRQFARKTL